ncbi:hypothetical protein ACI8AK_05190 [Geodermatophilus sp. SYSU D00867]
MLLRGSDGNPTAEYKAYLEHQAAFREAKRRYEKALTEAQQQPDLLRLWPIHGMALDKEVRAAYDRWVSFGHKEKVEAALTALEATRPES